MTFRVRVYCNSQESLALVEKMLLRRGRSCENPNLSGCFAVDFPVGGGELDSVCDWVKAIARKYCGWLTDYKVMMTENLTLKDLKECPRLRLSSSREETPFEQFQVE